MKNKTATPPVPRTIDEIRKEITPIWIQAGEVQYTIEQQKRLLFKINVRLQELNDEANQRGAMDTIEASKKKAEDEKLAQEKLKKAEKKRTRKSEAKQCLQN